MENLYQVKCENYTIFKQNCTLELFIAVLTWPILVVSVMGNLDFPDFLPKKFYNINYSTVSVDQVGTEQCDQILLL